ncbi:gliding motility-associated C-terminal domain-containing protein, partial [Flavobacterium sp. 245]|uniref:gliding motility-associated C-terminal domain-containing protein n=1 Tax=Flavobacterium sp. 245 TaxID=2512115 RepID=UPI00141511E0
NSTDYTATGTYPILNNGCTADQELQLTVTPKPVKIITTTTICSGETYTWSANSVDYTATGTYPIANNGCTADQELQLTVTPKPSKIITTATICSGETYTWSANSTDYTATGTYPILNNGCTADQELQLTVTPKPAKIITTATICSGETYTWSANSVDYTATGTYPIANNGCTADQELQLTVTPKPSKIITTATICSGETYTWSANATDYTAGGTYPITNNGCTADQELQLTVTPKPSKVITTATICSGETYTWSANATDYTAGGTYPIANNGCTADQELQLTVTPKPSKIITTATICSGETYTWSANATDYTAGGTYPIANNGCTADQELQLTVTNVTSPIIGLITHPTCLSSTASVELSGLPAGSWIINPGNISGNTATTTITGLIAGNTYNYTVTDSFGCQSAVSANVTVSNYICAEDDTPSTINGAAGGTISTVFANDKINRNSFLPTDITISTSSLPTGIVFNTDGTITVAPNTLAGTHLITYTICMSANSSVCDSATLEIIIERPVIDAVSETTASINSNIGGTTISLTANDTLNGTPVTVGTGAGQVGFTLVSTLPSGLTLNADKTITVAPGTASGNYEVEYTICDNDHALNCDTVKSYVQVNGDVLVANADNPASVTASNQPQTIITVVDNDTRNGQPLTASEVKITTTVPNASGYLTLDPSTGIVSLGANAPAGIYTLTYSICDKTNTSNCSTASVSLTVNAPIVIPVIDAVTETTASINSNIGGTTISLTANDTLNGTPVTVGTGAGQVGFTLVSTLPAGLTLNADKTITVAPGTASGNYELEYTICDNDHAFNCDTVKSYVQVTGDVLVANADNPASVTVSNQPQTIITVVDNDTRNGQPLTASEVKITTTVPDASGYLTLDPSTGIVTLGANAPAGTYTLTYSICDKTNASNCSTATVSLTVNASVVIPVIDAVTETTASINSNIGGTTISLTANDMLNGTLVTVGTGAGQVGFTLVSTLPAGLTLNADKTITVAPGTASGNYEVEYTICDNDHALNCDTVKSYVHVTGDLLVLKDDLAGPIAGVNHAVTVINVLGNDTKNGLPIAVSDINLSVTIADPSGYLTLNPDGTIVLKENAPAGTYDLTYQVCELNTTNCATANVKVTVVPPTMTITANSYCSNDVPYVSYNVTPDNFTTNNLLTVKWIDSANNVVATQTNLPLSGSILWPGAIVDSNGIGVDWPGWLLTNGQWIEGADGFEKTRTGVTIEFSLNPTVSISVSYPPATPQCNARPTFEIKANNDSAGPIDAKKGISTALNIFSNDRLNGTAVNQTAVVLSTVVANPNLILNADGSVDVKSGTPSGTYQLTYQICEASNSSNCSQAVVNVTVVNSDDPAPAPQIITKDDLQVNVDGINGQLEFINILDNDLLNGVSIDPANVVISNIPKSPYFEFNADGTVNVKPNTPGGSYAVVYQICEKANATNCASATLNVFVEVPNIAIIKTAVFNDENGNGFANAGETITYKFKVTNTGNVPLTKIVVKDPLPGVVVSGSAIDLAVGEANENNFTAQYKITQSDIILGTVSNQATAFGFSARGVDVEDKSDDASNTGDNPTVLSLNGCQIKVLNAFSPNGDSKNARFYIQGIECYPDNTVEIYNRWGVLVFDTDHYNNQDRVFVGVSAGRATVKESDGLPVGTYFYVLKYKDGDSNPHEQSGYLYLNK